MHGFADDLAEAKEKLRAAFDSWMEWALAMPTDDLKYPRIAAELKNIGRLKDAEPIPAQ
jgi:hypothetical protein